MGKPSTGITHTALELSILKHVAKVQTVVSSVWQKCVCTEQFSFEREVVEAERKGFGFWLVNSRESVL